MVASRVRVPAWAIFHRAFNFSMNYHPQYKNTRFYFQTIGKKKYSIILIISSDYYCGLLIGLMDPDCYTLLSNFQ